jgi:peroxiredoxin Q/BCP
MKSKSFAIMIFSFISSLLAASPLEIGSAAPQITAPDHEGKQVDLGKELSQGTTLVFFYPKALTPGCTKQACSLRDGWDELQTRDVKIFGVSSDTAATQTVFRNKYNLPFTLIADTDQIVSKAFGKNRWSRQAYIFRDGKLVWIDLKASTSDQASDVLLALDALK